MELLQKKLEGIKFHFTKDLECAICLELLTDPVVTKCNHQFCRTCLRNAIEKRCIKRCPICNEVLSKRSMVESATLKPLIRDLKLLLAAVESDFELLQDMKVASELMPAQSKIPASKPADVQLDKGPGQPKEAHGEARTFLTQISEEHKQRCVGNITKVDVLPEVTAKCTVSTKSMIKNSFNAKPEENLSRDKDIDIVDLEAEVDAQSHISEIVMAHCGEDGSNSSGQSTIELVLEKKPPINAVPCSSISATSKVEKWLMNRCVQDSDSPSSDVSKLDRTNSSKDTISKISGRIFKSKAVLDKNECVENKAKDDREVSQDPYSFISSQKDYPKKGRKRQTKREKRRSEVSKVKGAGGKFADLINLRERKIRKAKEKAMQAAIENSANMQELQSQPFPSSCLVNVHDKFDEFVLNSVSNERVRKPLLKHLEKTELWNDDEDIENVFLTPAYTSKSPNREKENLVNLESSRKRKSRMLSTSRNRKMPKFKEDDNNALNLLKGEIMEAEQHELCIEAPKRKLRSKLCTKSIMPGTEENSALPSLCDNAIGKLTANSLSTSKAKDSSDMDVQNYEDIIMETSVEVTRTENKRSPLNVKNVVQKQSSRVTSDPLIPKQKVTLQPADRSHREKSPNSTNKDASVRYVRTPDKKGEHSLNVQMPEEISEKHIVSPNHNVVAAAVDMQKQGNKQQPIIVEDLPTLPGSDVQELTNVQKSSEKQISKISVAPATKVKMCEQIISKGNVDKPDDSLQICSKSTRISRGKVDDEPGPEPVENSLTVTSKICKENAEKQISKISMEPATNMQICEEIMPARNVDKPDTSLQSCSKPTRLAKCKVETLDKVPIITEKNAKGSSNAHDSTESKLMSEVDLELAKSLIRELRMKEAEISTSTPTHIHAALLHKNFTPTALDFGESFRKHSDDMGLPLVQEIPVPKTKSVPEALIAEQMDATAVSYVSNRSLRWQCFGRKHGAPLFSFVKLGNLYRSVAGLHHSVACQTEPSDQSFASNNENGRSSLADISSNSLNKNSAVINICRSVECQTVPEETFPVKCQHCLSNVPRAESEGSLKTKILDSQDDDEIVIPPSQDTPYLDAELIGLYKFENSKKLPEKQTKPSKSQNNYEIQATASFDVVAAMPFTETDTGPSLDILAPETCTHDFDKFLNKMVDTSAVGEEIVPESETGGICVDDVNEIKNVPKSYEAEVVEDNMFMEDDVIPPTPPSEKASGVRRWSPGISPSGVSQKRKLAQSTPITYNKKTKLDVDPETKFTELRVEAERLNVTAKSEDQKQSPVKHDCERYTVEDSEDNMAKVVANINMDLQKSTIIDDDIDGIFTPEVTVLEVSEPMQTVDNARATKESASIKDTLDNEMSEEIFDADHQEFAKPYPTSATCSKTNKLPECGPHELTQRGPLSTDEENALVNGIEFKSLDWKDFGTEDDSCEVLPRNKEQSTASTLQTLPTTQQRETLKKDIEKDQQQLKEIEMLLAKKQHTSFKPCDENEDDSKSEPEAEKISTYEFDSDGPYEECLMSDDEIFHVPENKIDNNAAELTSRGIFSWDQDLGSSWGSQVNTLSQRKMCQGLQKCMPKVDTSPTIPIMPKLPALNYSLVVSGCGASEQHAVQLLATQLKGSFHSKFNDSTTHVIVKLVGNLCERTLKYILGISAGRWIVSYKWVTDSIMAGKAMPEADYEVVGDTNDGLHNGPHKARTNLGKPLLSDYEIFLMKPFTELTEDQLKMILKYCGAKYVSDPAGFSGKDCSKQMVVCESQFHKTGEFDVLLQKNKVVVVTRDWLLDSIASYTIKPTKTYTLR